MDSFAQTNLDIELHCLEYCVLKLFWHLPYQSLRNIETRLNEVVNRLHPTLVIIQSHVLLKLAIKLTEGPVWKIEKKDSTRAALIKCQSRASIHSILQTIWGGGGVLSTMMTTTCTKAESLRCRGAETYIKELIHFVDQIRWCLAHNSKQFGWDKIQRIMRTRCIVSQKGFWASQLSLSFSFNAKIARLLLQIKTPSSLVNKCQLSVQHHGVVSEGN